MHKFIIFYLLILFAVSCQNDRQQQASQSHQDQNISVTQWTEKMEIFIEYPVAEQKEPVKFIVHLTTLNDFKPVTEGKVVLNFVHENGKTEMVEKDELLREGIFTPEATFSQIGKYNFTLTYMGPNVSELFEIGDFVVYQDHRDVPASADDSEIGISFLKEQQWKTTFHTSVPQQLKIQPSVSVIGEVLPNQRGYAEIVSPVEGILNVQHNQGMVIPGSKVRKGDVLVTVCPPLDGGNSWTDLQLSYQKSKAEFERAERLLEKKAISDREYQELKRIYLIHKSGYEAFLNLTQGESMLSSEIENNHLAIKSQINGTVAEVMAKTGQHVSVGEKLMTVLDPSIVWIQMNIYEKDYYKIGEPQGASILLPGTENPIILEKKDWLVLSRGELVDLQRRTIPLLVEIENRDRLFKVGQILHMELYTSQEKEVMCIPETAVFDEDIQRVVYVQTEGELFEKRVVETGAIYKGWIEIQNGMDWEDRVVTDGGYMIKLASTMSEIGHPHVH